MSSTATPRPHRRDVHRRGQHPAGGRARESGTLRARHRPASPDGPMVDGPAHLLLRPEQLVLHVERGARTVVAVGRRRAVPRARHLGGPRDRRSRPSGAAGSGARRPRAQPGQPVWVEVRGRGRVWSIDDHGRIASPGSVESRGGEGADASLWMRPDPLEPGPAWDLVVPGPAPAPRGGRRGPPRRRGRLVGAAVVVVGAAVLAAVLLLGGGSSPSAVGPVVFHGSIASSGEFHTHETFTDASTAKKARRVPRPPPMAIGRRRAPTPGSCPRPPQQHRRAQDRDGAQGLPRTGPLRTECALTGQRGDGRRPRVLRPDEPRCTASLTVDADGSGLSHSPMSRRRRQSPPGLARGDLGHHRLDLYELRSQPKKNSAARGEPPSRLTGHL